MNEALCKLLDKTANRKETFKFALNLAENRNIKSIVETGTARIANNFAGDGLSTLIFGEYCKEHNINMYTCDINKKAINVSKKITKEYEDYITYIEGDSVEFLNNFKDEIDFLYLDSFDCYANQIQAAQVHNLNEFKASEDKFTDNTIIFIDDYSNSKNGKCALTLEYINKMDYSVHYGSKQIVIYK